MGTDKIQLRSNKKKSKKNSTRIEHDNKIRNVGYKNVSIFLATNFLNSEIIQKLLNWSSRKMHMNNIRYGPLKYVPQIEEIHIKLVSEKKCQQNFSKITDHSKNSRMHMRNFRYSYNIFQIFQNSSSSFGRLSFEKSVKPQV